MASGGVPPISLGYHQAFFFSVDMPRSCRGLRSQVLPVPFITARTRLIPFLGYPERLLIYHSGVGRIVFLGCMKITTLFLFAFSALVVAPRFYYSPDEPNWAAAAGRCFEPTRRTLVLTAIQFWWAASSRCSLLATLQHHSSIMSTPGFRYSPVNPRSN